jgi:hypothetical protein
MSTPLDPILSNVNQVKGIVTVERSTPTALLATSVPGLQASPGAFLLRIPVLATGEIALVQAQTTGMAGRSATCRSEVPKEAIVIDPFFIDRLMHAFTTAHSTPLSRAAEQAATDQQTAQAAEQAPTCRALREAEAVVAEVLRREQTGQIAGNQPGANNFGG